MRSETETGLLREQDQSQKLAETLEMARFPRGRPRSPPETPQAAVIATFQEWMESESRSETRFSVDRVCEDLPLSNFFPNWLEKEGTGLPWLSSG